MNLRAVVLSGWVAAVAGCGSSSLKAQGEECVASSECEDGLTCDFGQTPAVCSEQQTPQPDAAPVQPPDAAVPGPDADPNAPDAAPVPDAAPGTPDAPPPIPDAAVPDAPPPPLPDAAVPDATPLPDA